MPGLGPLYGFAQGGAKTLKDILAERMAQQEFALQQENQRELIKQRQLQTEMQRKQFDFDVQDRATQTAQDQAKSAEYEQALSLASPEQRNYIRLRRAAGFELPKPEKTLSERMGEREAEGMVDASIEQAKRVPPQTLADKVTETTALAEARAGVEDKHRQPTAPKEDRLVTVTTIDDQGNEVTRYLPESQVRGQTFVKPKTGTAGGGGKLAAAAIEKIAGIDQADAILRELATLKQDAWLGPAAGRLTEASIQTPGIRIDPELAKFAAQSTTLKNAVVKAITGAQMSEPEAKRIMAQIPAFTDKPEVWEQKRLATLENQKLLKRRILELSGASDAASPADTTAGDGKSVTVTELQAIAQRKGTTIEQETARARAAGYDVR